jgi:hypothetical protein
MFHNNWIGIVAVIISLGCGFLFYYFWVHKIWSKRNIVSQKRISLFKNKFFRILLIVLSLSFLFYLDFLRDYLFKNLTYRMNYIDVISNGGSTDKYFDPTDSLMQKILNGFTAQQIYYLKFLSTFLTLGLYFLTCQIILKLIYLRNNTLVFTSLLYGTGFLLMMFVFSFYFFTSPNEIKYNFYLISMEIGHFLESSLPTLLLILSYKIYLSSQNFNQIE